MNRWKTAGRAARKDDDALWARFRAAQDAFFAARNAVSGRDRRRVPGEPDRQGSAAGRGRGAAAGRRRAGRPGPPCATSRNAGRPSARCRAPTSAGSRAGCAPSSRPSATPSRTGGPAPTPQARARAEDVVAQLETTIAEPATDGWRRPDAAGDTRAATEAEQAIAAREEWLAQARTGPRRLRRLTAPRLRRRSPRSPQPRSAGRRPSPAIEASPSDGAVPRSVVPRAGSAPAIRRCRDRACRWRPVPRAPSGSADRDLPCSGRDPTELAQLVADGLLRPLVGDVFVAADIRCRRRRPGCGPWPC